MVELFVELPTMAGHRAVKAIISFSDIVGSTAAANWTDLDNYGEIVKQFRDCVHIASGAVFPKSWSDRKDYFIRCEGDEALLIVFLKGAPEEYDEKLKKGASTTLLFLLALRILWALADCNTQRYQSDVQNPRPIEIASSVATGEILELENQSCHLGNQFIGFGINLAKRLVTSAHADANLKIAATGEIVEVFKAHGILFSGLPSIVHKYTRIPSLNTQFEWHEYSNDRSLSYRMSAEPLRGITPSPTFSFLQLNLSTLDGGLANTIRTLCDLADDSPDSAREGNKALWDLPFFDPLFRGLRNGAQQDKKLLSSIFSSISAKPEVRDSFLWELGRWFLVMLLSSRTEEAMSFFSCLNKKEVSRLMGSLIRSLEVTFLLRPDLFWPRHFFNRYFLDSLFEMKLRSSQDDFEMLIIRSFQEDTEQANELAQKILSRWSWLGDTEEWEGVLGCDDKLRFWLIQFWCNGKSYRAIDTFLRNLSEKYPNLKRRIGTMVRTLGDMGMPINTPFFSSLLG